jgi:UDP-glucose 4-epimerase
LKIIVTGAAGNIGATLCNQLHLLGHQLFMMDNLNNGYRSNLGESLSKKLIEIDIASKELFKFNKPGINAIINLAAITSLPDCEFNKDEAFRVNVLGVKNILEYARENSIPYVVHASTSAVYESNQDEIFVESLEVRPKLFYSLSKKMAEDLIDSYRVNYGLSVGVLRFFNVFGPLGDVNRKNPPLINYLIREFMNSKVPVLTGDGTQERDFIHVDDVVSALVKCMTQRVNQTYNICSGHVISVNQMAKWVAECFDKDISFVEYREPRELWDQYPSMFKGTFPLNKDAVAKEALRKSRGCFNKAARELGWFPNIDFENLVKSVVERARHG